MTAYDSRAHADAAVAALEALGVTTGDGGGDADGPVRKDLDLPYAVVYWLGSGGFDGPMSAEHLDDDAEPTFQVTFCGEGREQAQWLQKTVRDGILGSRLNVDGAKCGPIRLHMERPAGRDTTVTPYVWWAVDQYRYASSPA